MSEIASEAFNLQLLIAALACFGGTFLQGYAGFGGGLIIIPMMTIIYAPIEGIAAGTISGFLGQLSIIPEAVRGTDRRESLPVLTAVAITTPLCAMLFLANSDPRTIKVIIGAFVIAFGLLLMAGINYRGPRGPLAGLAVGSSVGTLTGSIGAPASPIYAAYFLSSNAPVRVQRANLSLTTVLVIGMIAAGLAMAGKIGMVDVVRGFSLTPPAVAGAWCGAAMFRRMPASWFRPIALWLLICAGLAAIFL